MGVNGSQGIPINHTNNMLLPHQNKKSQGIYHLAFGKKGSRIRQRGEDR